VLENQLQDHNRQIGQEKERVDRHGDQLQDHDRQIAHLDKKVRMLEDVIMEFKLSTKQLVAEMAAVRKKRTLELEETNVEFLSRPKTITSHEVGASRQKVSINSTTTPSSSKVVLVLPGSTPSGLTKNVIKLYAKTLYRSYVQGSDVLNKAIWSRNLDKIPERPATPSFMF
jgi:predicted RNase H-like nuclease (RuvC/YqgF family)